MARIIIAVVYIAAILVIGILAGRNVKTSEEFATANRGIPFWTNVFSMSSAWIGAGSTLGCASMCYAYGVSGFLSGYRRRHWRYVVQPAVCS